MKALWCGNPKHRKLRTAQHNQSSILTLSLTQILVVIGVGALALHFFGAIRVRELALQAAVRAGRDGDFQLLDQSVHINRMSLSRDRNGRWRVWRQYRFDYTFDGVARRQGFVVMLGRELQSVLVAEDNRTLH